MPSKDTKTRETGPEIAEAVATEPIGPEDAVYSKPWMIPWLIAAANATNAVDACKTCDPKVPMSKYLEGRVVDPKFDAVCRVFDQIVELRIIEKVRMDAALGDSRAQGLYFKEVRRPAFAPTFASWNAPSPPPAATNPLPPEVADAMLVAGLTAFENLKPPAAKKKRLQLTDASKHRAPSAPPTAS